MGQAYSTVRESVSTAGSDGGGHCGTRENERDATSVSEHVSTSAVLVPLGGLEETADLGDEDNDKKDDEKEEKKEDKKDDESDDCGSHTSSASQEECFYVWRRSSDDEEAKSRALAMPSDANVGWHDEGSRSSLASTIPLEDQCSPDMARLPSPADASTSKKMDPSEYQEMLEGFQHFGMQGARSAFSETSTVAQRDDKPMMVNPGSLSGSGGTTWTRSVGSGGSQSTRGDGRQSHECRESREEERHRGSLSEGVVGELGELGNRTIERRSRDPQGQHMERRESSTSARTSLTLERADVRANRSSFDAFQKALKEQEKRQRQQQAVHEQELLRSNSNVFRDSQNVQDYEEYPKDVEFLMALGVPKEVCRDAWMLTVLPPNTPAPAHMLSNLWNRPMPDTQACMTLLAELGVMSVAKLGDQLWGLPRERFMQQLHLHLLQERPIVSFHRCLVNGYAREAWGKQAKRRSMAPVREDLGEGTDVGGEPPMMPEDGVDEGRRDGQCEWEWEEPHYLIHDGEMLSSLLLGVEDDGYIVTNLVYHLVGARLDGVVRRLLLNPAWLERKLMLSRTTASADASLIMADFRRYLMLYSDNDVKLVLEALQLSMAALKENLVPGLLQTQVTGRLIAAPLIVREPWMHVKYHSSAGSMSMGAHMPMSVCGSKEHVVALPVLNPCLDQAGGVQRSCLKCGHSRPKSRGSGSSMSSGGSALSSKSMGSVGTMGSIASLGSVGTGGSKLSSSRSSVSISGYVSVGHVEVVPTINGTMEAVSAASDGSLTVWDLEIGDSLNVIWAHQGPVTGLGVTSDGSLVVSASTDGMIRAYALENYNLLRSFGTPNSAVMHMVLDPHGRFVVTADPRGQLVTWDLVSARPVHKHQTNSKVTCLVLSSCDKYAIAGTEDGDILGMSVDTGATSFLLKGHTAAVTQIVATSGCKGVFSASHDRELRVWYGVQSSSSASTCTCDVMTNSGSIVSLHLTKDRKTAICGLDTGNAVVWDVCSKTCTAVLEGGHAGPVTCITMLHDEKHVLTAGYDGTIIVWSLKGDFLRVLEGHSGAITGLHTLSRNGFAITGSEDGSVRVWDSKASEIHTAHWHAGIVRALTCGRAGIAVTVGDDCIARVWNAGLGEHLHSYLKHKSSIRWCAQSEDGYRILTASPDRQITVWDPRTGSKLYGAEAKDGSRVKTFSASAALTNAVCCLFDSTVEVWDLVAGRVSWIIQRPGQQQPSQQRTGHTSAVNKVLMTTDGRLVVTASKDCTARIWDVANRICKHVLIGHEDSVVGMVLEQASRTLVTFSLDHSLIVWDLESGKRISRAKFKSPITRTALSINGKVAIALSNGCVNLIDLHSGDIREIPRLHRADITSLAFSRDGNLLISSSRDCSIKVIDLARGCVRGVAVLDSPITCFAIDRESKHLVAGTDRGTVAFIDMGALL